MYVVHVYMYVMYDVGCACMRVTFCMYVKAVCYACDARMSFCAVCRICAYIICVCMICKYIMCVCMLCMYVVYV